MQESQTGSLFVEGDLVEAVKGETVIRGRVTSTNASARWITVDDIRAVIFLATWTITVIEKAAPKLPTEPGSVLRGTEANRAILMRRYPINGRDPEGPWVSVSGVTYSDAEAVRFFHGQFTPLEPVPVTAKKIIDAMRRVAEERAGNPWNASVTIDAVAAEFGVTE